MSPANIFRFIVAVILAGGISDTIHIYYGHAFAGVATYSSFIMVMSYLTKPLEALGAAIIYYFIGDRLYSDSRFIKGIILAILICLIRDGLIRQVFMNILLGNPILDSFVRESQEWLSVLMMSLIISFIIQPKK